MNLDIIKLYNNNYWKIENHIKLNLKLKFDGFYEALSVKSFLFSNRY